MSALLPAVTDATFDELVLSSDTPVLVDFWAEWCPPCRALTPLLAGIASDHPGLTILGLDADENPETVLRYRALALPVMNVYVGGEVVKSILGAKPRHILEHELAPYL